MMFKLYHMCHGMPFTLEIILVQTMVKRYRVASVKNA